ncbi:MAG: hypothetical protein FWF63_02000 [Fibromonadales bacterium]|nr:hypothetical protein [Fibromonadales bacterium]
MKKFLYPLPFVALLCVFFFNCSSEGFKLPNPDELGGLNISDTKENVKCIVEKGENKSCYEISKNACKIIGGREKDSTETCISFSCEWNSNSIEYGQESILSFKWGNVVQEGCYMTISPLDTGNHIISASTIAGLTFLRDTTIVAKATVTCGAEQPPIIQNCKPLTVKSVPVDFTCEWDSGDNVQVKYGGKSTLHFAFDPASVNIAQREGCIPTISPLDPGEHLISASTITGLSYSTDTVIVAKATVTCGNQVIPTKDCKPLTVTHVPGPEKTGTLSFKKSDYKSNDTNYFFVNTRVDSTYINNGIKITNKEESGCGDIKIKIDGSPAKIGTQVRATAAVTCEHIGELELDGISAAVLPDYKVGKCEFSGKSKETMRSDDTLTVGISVDNSYGRCTKIEYTFNGSTYISSSSYALTSSGGTELKNIKAKVTCSGKDTTVSCPAVSVARYQELKTECREANRDKRDKITFKSGKTIIDFVCDTDKKDYYISCDTNPRTNFSVEIDGYKEGDSENDIRPNGGDSGYNFPGLQAIPEGNLYRYPISVTINNKTSGDLKCGIW